MLTRLETARLQEFGNDGLPLVNGKLYFYALQTTTPKETYQDIFGTALNTNPVQLDSVGSASVYLNGSYTVSAVDQFGVVVGPPVDIAGGLNDFTTSAGGNFANNIVLSVNTYSDIRGLGVAYAWVFCQGRETQGDGGQGLFYYSIDNSVDDDGITLSPNINGSYVRYNLQNIDPRWFGLVYGGIVSQESFLILAGKASERYGIPLKVDGEVFINSNFSTSLWASEWIFSSNASLVSTLGITFTFTSNNRLLECGQEVFKNNVQPIFEEFATDMIRFSWMGGSNEEGKVAKLLAASIKTYTITFDRRVITTNSIEIPENFYLFIGSTSTSGNIYFDTSTSVNLSIPKLLPGSNLENVVKYREISTIGNITLGFSIDPIFFCSNTINETLGIIASIRSGNISLQHSYTTSASINTGNSTKIVGNNYSFSISELSLSSIDISSLFFTGKLTSVNSIIKDSVFTLTTSNLGISYIKDSTINSSSNISGTFYLDNVISNATFSRVNSCIDCSFGNYISSASIFSGNLTNTTFDELSVGIENVIVNSLVINTSGVNPVFYISGENTVNSSKFISQDYKILCFGTSGTIDFNNCVFSPKIIVSNKSGVVYNLNNCVGFIKESNCRIDSLEKQSYEFTSAAPISIFKFISAGTSATQITNSTSAGSSIIFTSAGSYDYVTSSVGACVYVGTSANSALTNFNTFGGDIEIKTENVGNSRFKICVVPVDWTYNNLHTGPRYTDLTKHVSLSGTNEKSIAETPWITSNSHLTFSYQTGLTPTNIKAHVLYDDYNLSDKFSLRNYFFTGDKTLTYNTDIVIIGFVDSNTKITLTIQPNVPKNNLTLNNFYNVLSANSNTYETVSAIEYLTQQPYISSGVNNVSRLWIEKQSYESTAEKVYIKGICPTVYNQSRTNNFAYLLSNGFDMALAPELYVSATYSPTTSALNPLIYKNNLQITLSPIVSGNLTAKPPEFIKPLSATSAFNY